ncbi:response regulator [Paenibacillus chondroitinus]
MCIAALTAFRKIDPQVKVILCSAMGQQRMVTDAIQARAKDFIVKPFHKDRVSEALTRVLQS